MYKEKESLWRVEKSLAQNFRMRNVKERWKGAEHEDIEMRKR